MKSTYKQVINSLLIIIFFYFPIAVNAQVNWDISVIDKRNDVGSNSSITVDATDKLAVSYCDISNGDLKFARQISKNHWQTSVIDSSLNVGYYSSITSSKISISDATEYLISYYDMSNGDLKFARSTNSGKTWQVKTIDSHGDVGQSTSIHIDHQNNYLISYYDADLRQVKIARSTDQGQSWEITSLSDEIFSGPYNSITSDSENNYLLSYDSFRSMKFAKSIDGGATWNNIIVDQGIDLGLTNSIKVDSATNTYLIAYVGTHRDVRTINFAKSVDGGATWNFQTLGDDWAGDFVSLAVDSKDYAIAYYDNYHGDLKYAKSIDDGGTWELGIVETNQTDVGRFNNIIINQQKDYVVSYYDATNGDLKLAVSRNNLLPFFSK